MDSLGNNLEERGFPLTECVGSNMNGFNNIRNPLKGLDAENFGVSRNMFEGQGFIEPHLPGMKEKSVLHTQFLKDSLADANCDSGRSLPSTSTITMNSSAETVKRLSSLTTKDEQVMISDFKVGKMESRGELKGGSVSVGEPAKRARMASLQSQNPVCIVHGCNKDLNSSKEYHKRHKVCDIHSKTAVVIVNGVRQRFCQQCSRFHVLAEFDNGKRSCRKRLAGHNRRRRKPQLDPHSGLCRTSLFFSACLRCSEPIRHTNELLKFGSSPPPPLLHLNERAKYNPSNKCSSSPLSAMPNSSCAPSLLSAQSQSSFCHPATNYPPPFNPNTSSGAADQGVHQCGTPTELVLHEPPSAPAANTVDLLQLALHLQRVEHQKQSEQAFFYFHHQHLMY